MTLQDKIQKKAEGFGQLAPVFLEGAKFALENQWISVNDDLPCNHDSLLIKCLPYSSEITKSVLALVDDGSYQVCEMFINEEGEWEWSYSGDVIYWMQIPEPPKEQETKL